MPDDPEQLKKRSRAKLAAVLRSASEELLAEGDAEGARIAVGALKEPSEFGELAMAVP